MKKMLFLIWLIVIASCVALFLSNVYSRFKKYGVHHIKPLPILGNSGQFLFRKKHFIEYFTALYHTFPGDRFIGNYNFIRPAIVVKDLELLKNIVIKDFEHFLDRASFLDESVEPIAGRNLLSLRGQEWKDMRSALSPAFTSSKMRLMVPFMKVVCDQMNASLKKNIENSKDNYVDVECRDLAARFANDVIASCAFGVKVDSHNEKENEFFRMGKLATTVRVKQFLMIQVLNTYPKLTKALKLSFFEPGVKNFFKSLVLNMITEREANNIYRPDMIHLLMEAKKGKLTLDHKNAQDSDIGFATVEESAAVKKDMERVWSDTDLVAQAVVFFFAGFDTVSTTISFLLYEIALHPKVQERLVQEIKENHFKNGGKFDYNSLQDMTYMDMAISESLRKWPPIAVLDRMCLKDYNLGKPHSGAMDDYIIRKGEAINIPVWAIQNDPEYYPDPEKYDPERFSNKNKHLIKPLTYMPFGVGPRNCLGTRFALSEVKVMLYHLLLNFQLFPCEKTCIPARLDKFSVGPLLEGGHWLRFKIRE